MDEVVLARHGESETSGQGLVGGDAPRTERGCEQARLLSDRLAACRWVGSHPTVRAPNGESRVHVLARLARPFRGVLGRSERQVVVGPHGLTPRAVLDEQPQPVVARAPFGGVVRLSRPELEQAVEPLERWYESPSW